MSPRMESQSRRMASRLRLTIAATWGVCATAALLFALTSPVRDLVAASERWLVSLMPASPSRGAEHAPIDADPLSLQHAEDYTPITAMHMVGNPAFAGVRSARAAQSDLVLDRLLGSLPRSVARAAVEHGGVVGCAAKGVGPAGASSMAAASAMADERRTVLLPVALVGPLDGASVSPLPSPSATAAADPTGAPGPSSTPAPAASPTVPAASDPAEPTWWRDVRPIVARECATCHYDGGIGPFPLETYVHTVQMAAAMEFVLREGLMPPLPAVPDGETPLDDPRAMSVADRATVLAWLAAGLPEGDEADRTPVEEYRDPYGPPAMTFDIGVDFLPPFERLDEYRCFVIDPGLAEDLEVAMVDLEPTNAKIFHHGILYLALPAQVARVAQLEAADPEPGYECFGGPGFNSTEWVIAEAVGSPRRPYPAGTAKVLPAGSRLVLQLHYNTLNGVSADRTRVHMWLPEHLVGREPVDVRLANFWFNIPSGAKEHVASASLRIGEPGGLIGRGAPPGDVYQVWGHMHLLGASLSLDLHRKSGGTQRLLDIPRWDFNWQGVYDLRDPVPVVDGDELIMTCTWDNSPSNQPFVDGRQVAPRAVRWGEGTLDEMCLGGVTIVE